MGRPKRNLLATVEDTLTPPDALTATQSLAKVAKAEGNNLYSVDLPSGNTALVELNPRFRSTIWIKRGSYVVVDQSTLAERENKIQGEIVNVVRDEKAWRKQGYWPKEFPKVSTYPEDSDDDDNRVGMMPPSDSEDE
ncbi:uncharacterized protein K452DRAFT_224702 [Aplosporella prunicola CBS 121167]|uniref:S1-like domain-containing protein n=1 Tax=Aplosporella prunicola CBS 121167 TaxID=1176127 RepID=A0A6A6BKF6_9PEZI|nr:uncharacterized protein K452DRAFT_224702 [Aplosporella prunicola CBS 121167]KAF2143764.1 hypothetical protein K452DRAFT_224702 [Aplosporella prunicola CBS 121167]